MVADDADFLASAFVVHGCLGGNFYSVGRRFIAIGINEVYARATDGLSRI